SSVGVVNGAVVGVLKVSPLLVTLGTWSIVYGVALYMTSGIPIYGMPSEFTRDFGRLKLFGLPISLYIMALVLVTFWWIMNWTRLGRYIYAIGGNIHAARVSGIRTTTYLIITYTMCAFLAAVTGVLLTARVGSGEATMGTTFMLESIAAAVIGGVSLRGGVGRVELVALGALFLSLVSNGMNLIRVDSKIQTIVVGIVVILAVALDQMGSRRARR
ncbi:MAG: ABC transporter permease, partial [Alphaproteobacteria bacterium]|nr:ABC transporter permease [Alphaproteobacteria bacterium]